MSGVAPLLPLYAFMAWTRKTLSPLKQQILPCKFIYVFSRSACAALLMLLCLVLSVFTYSDFAQRIQVPFPTFVDPVLEFLGSKNDRKF